jgi:hypothetical protein
MYVLHVSAFGHLQALYIIYFSVHALFTNINIKYYVFIDQWYSNFFVRVPPDIIYLQLCTPKVVGT